MAFIIFFLFIYLLKKFEKVEKTGFFRANTQISNLNVLHKGLLMQDWVFRLGDVCLFVFWKKLKTPKRHYLTFRSFSPHPNYCYQENDLKNLKLDIFVYILTNIDTPQPNSC